MKGIFQGIKYKALMEALKGRVQDHGVKAFLVAYSIPQDIAEYAESDSVAPVEIEQKVIGPRQQTG